jgi:hypothetical protein
MRGIVIAMFEAVGTAHEWPLYAARRGSRSDTDNAVKPRSTEREEVIMQRMAKEAESASCENPAEGEERVALYIVNDLTEDARRKFVAHIADCSYCLEQVVLWRLAEVLVEETKGDQRSAQTD